MSWNANISDDEENNEELHTWGGRDGIIFLVDCSKQMFEENDSEKAKIRICFDYIETIMKNRIISSDKDLMGIVLYNTELSPESKDELDTATALTVPKNIAIFENMRPVNIDSVKYVRNFKESEDLFDFENKYGHSTDCNLSEAYWLCSRMFSMCGYKLQGFTIFQFTLNDQPHIRGTSEYQQSIVKAGDMQQLGYYIFIVAMSDNFNPDLFYKEFLSIVCDEDMDENDFILPIILPDTQNTLLLRNFRRDFRKRCNHHLQMYMGDNIKFGVGLYSFSRKTKYPKKLALHPDTNEIIVSKRSHVGYEYSEDGTEILSQKTVTPSEQVKTQTYGGETVSFKAGEVTALMSLMHPSIRLLGFKPNTFFSLNNHLRSPMFLYPDEEQAKGSTVLFRALWERCLIKEKVAICVITARRKAHPRYVALIPQENIPDEKSGKYQRYNGFRVVYLPTEGNIRNIDSIFQINENIDEVSPEAISIFEKITKKLNFPYNPELFSDPTLHNLYANIEALAFETDFPDEIDDSTMPDLERQTKKIGGFMDEIVEIFGENVQIVEKRPRPAVSTSSSTAKKTKNDDLDVETINEQVATALKNNLLDKLSVYVMRTYLDAKGIKGLSKLTKNVLKEKIIEINE